MPLELDGPQRAKLREALLDAYPDFGEVAKLTEDQLDYELNRIVSENKDLEDVMFALIRWCASQGRLEDLILGAVNSNPGNPKLFVFSQRLGLSSTDAKKSTLEKVVSGNDTFLDVAKWRAQLLRSEWRVCRVDYRGTGTGTGFLVGPDVVLTNHHVMRSAIAGNASAKDFSVRFDYKESEAGDVISSGTVVDLVDDSEWLIDSSPHSKHDVETAPTGEPGPDELDFALVRLAEDVGNKAVAGEEPRGWIEMSADEVDFGSLRGIFILQHPKRLPMKLAMGMDEQLDVSVPRRVRYEVPTEPGSSGSPVFDPDWRLVALHHAGDPAEEGPKYNEGIPISLIAQRPPVQDYLTDLEDEE